MTSMLPICNPSEAMNAVHKPQFKSAIHCSTLTIGYLPFQTFWSSYGSRYGIDLSILFKEKIRNWDCLDHRPRIIKNLRAIKTILVLRPFSLNRGVFHGFLDSSTIKRHYRREFGTLVSTAQFSFLWWQQSNTSQIL